MGGVLRCRNYRRWGAGIVIERLVLPEAVIRDDSVENDRSCFNPSVVWCARWWRLGIVVDPIGAVYWG